MTSRQLLFRAIGAGINAVSYVSPKIGGRMAFRLFGKPPTPNIRPKEQAFLDTAVRAVVMAVFSEVKWIFQVFTMSLGLRPVIFEQMQHYIQNRTGRKLEEFDVALNAHRLADVKALLIHDPEDKVTAFRNAQRNHSHWVNSALYAPKGAGHHLGTAGVTGVVLDFLREGTLPDGVRINHGELESLPAR